MPNDFYQRLQTGLLGQPDNYGGLLSEGDMSDARRQAMLAIGAQLMAAGGPSAQPVSLGQALGGAIMGGQQTQQQSINDRLNAALLKAQIEGTKAKGQQSPFGNINPSDFTPESLAAFQKTLDYSVLKPVAGKNIGNFNPGDYTPESFAKFQKTGDPADLVRYVTPATPSIQVVAGVPTVVQPSRTGGEPTQKPLSTLFAELDAAGSLAASKESGKQTGKLETDAKFDLPRVEQNVSESVNVIKSLRDHPGLPYITGWASKLPIVPDTPQAAADALAKQVQGSTFLQAYQTLKGGGQITEVEGKKAEQAIARLERAQSIEDYQGALDDLVGVLETGLQRARSAAGGSAGPKKRVRVDAQGNVIGN